MNNNDILRSLRYTFDISDSDMTEIFAQADFEANRAMVSNLLKKDDAPDFKNCDDEMLATFLNGFINKRRGKREGAQPVPEKQMTNNITFRKLKIALNLQSDDILDILDMADFRLSSHELSAFFRKEGHKHFRQCKDQVLRNFMHGLRVKHRPDGDSAE